MPSRPRILGVSAFVVFVGLAAVQTLPRAQSSVTLVVRGGTLIDPRTGNAMANATIVVRDERIVSVAPGAAVPAGAQVIDASGKYVLPGLWDSHAHTRDIDGTLYINHGITSTMDMGNILDWIMVMQEAREKQMSFGPRIFPQGMAIGGRLGPHEWNPKNVEEARWAAQQNLEAGVNFLKVYQEATPDMIAAVADEAHKAGRNLHGHIRKSDAREAILAGINALAHGSGIAAATSPPAVAARIKSGELSRELGSTAVVANYLQDPAMFDDLVKVIADHHVFIEPNFVYLFKGVHDRWDAYQLENHRLAANEDLQAPEMFVRLWANDYPSRQGIPTGELRAKLRKGLANHQLMVKKLSAAGVRFLAGTDSWYVTPPGLASWQEMELMADAGVPPLAVLQAATINPAEFVHKDKDLGTIEPGKLADLIILRANPLQNISNVRTLDTVIQHGKVQELGYHADYHNPIPRPWQVVNGEFPRPYISSVEPAAVPIGTADLVLTITGKDFNAENRVLWMDRDLRVIEQTATSMKVAVPRDVLAGAGTFKVHMITGGRVHNDSLNFGEVMVSYGRTFKQRWNGQTMTKIF